MSVSCFSLARLISTSPRKIWPDVSRSRPARQCSSVDFPEPDGPMIAVSARRLEVDGDAVERAHLGFAAAVDLGGVDGARGDVDGSGGTGGLRHGALLRGIVPGPA